MQDQTLKQIRGDPGLIKENPSLQYLVIKEWELPEDATKAPILGGFYTHPYRTGLLKSMTSIVSGCMLSLESKAACGH